MTFIWLRNLSCFFKDLNIRIIRNSNVPDDKRKLKNSLRARREFFEQIDIPFVKHVISGGYDINFYALTEGQRS